MCSPCKGSCRGGSPPRLRDCAPLQGELSQRLAAETEGFAPSVNDSLRHGACVRRSVTPPSKREAYVLPCKGSCRGGSPPRLRGLTPPSPSQAPVTPPLSGEDTRQADDRHPTPLGRASLVRRGSSLSAFGHWPPCRNCPAGEARARALRGGAPRDRISIRMKPFAGFKRYTDRSKRSGGKGYE